MPSESLKVASFLVLNAMSSIGIVYANKTLFVNYGFPYGTLLTVIHFIITFMGLIGCRVYGLFQAKRDVTLRQLLPLSLSFCGFVCLTNISLKLNSVGTYQLLKVLTTPLLLLIQFFCYGERTTRLVLASLAVICVGVVIATVSDSSANAAGTLVGLLAVSITCMYQIWVGVKQKELQCDSFQLLYYQAPLSALLLSPLIFVFDDMSHFHATFISAEGMSLRLGGSGIAPQATGRASEQVNALATATVVILSGILAFLVNISIYLVIGQTSPITYNVLGHFKLCVITCLGFLFFGDQPNVKSAVGILITLTGVFWYTHLKRPRTQAKASAPPTDSGPDPICADCKAT